MEDVISFWDGLFLGRVPIIFTRIWGVHIVDVGPPPSTVAIAKMGSYC